MRASLSLSLDYWRDFAALYLTALCQIPDVSGERDLDPIPPPTDGKQAELLLAVPPMAGAEYLSADVLEAIWQDLDQTVRGEVRRLGGIPAFLETHAPDWRQVGRVCFHLAENKRDPDYPFAFLATYIPGIARGAQARHQPLGQALKEYAGEGNNPALLRLLSPVHRASECSELARELVESGDLFQPLAWTPRDAYRFLTDVPTFESSGLVVRIPDWWRKRPKPQVQVRIGDVPRSSLDADSLLDFNIDLALGDERLTAKEWRDLLREEDGLVLLKGEWVEVDREKLEAALDHWKRVERASQSGISFAEGMRLLAGAPSDAAGGATTDEVDEWSFVRAGGWLGGVLEQLRSPSSHAALRRKNDLRATLRPYQQAGVEWLWLLASLGLGACLADDMGLGKTIQVLALLLRLKAEADRRPSLLVLPASLIANWISEIRRFAPSLRIVVAHPSETDRQALSDLGARPTAALAEVDLVLTTYAMLSRQKWLMEQAWELVILDEAQAIKNPSAAQTKTVKQLKARARIALTGTPVENRLSDLWSLFDFLCPGLLGSAGRFKQFVKDMQRGGHANFAPLRNLVRPYILRRLKTDRAVIADLPDKVEVTAYCGLTKRQAALYEKSVQDMRRALDAAEGIQRKGLVLSYLMRFKQICNHPSQWLGGAAYARGDSGKFERLAEIVEELASRQEKLLVFTQFREMTAPLDALLADVYGEPGLVLHGGTAVKQRQKLVERFQSETGPPYFVLSLKAGGTGLNLTTAAHVIHFDRWWNPAVENQATDRAFRIGQKRNVLVQKFVCRGTIEERIDRLIEDKKALAADLIEGGAETLLTEMSNAELLDLVALDVNRAGV